MRADMGKVLVERPRPGSRDGSRPRKGYDRQLRKELARDAERRRESMTARTGGTRFFNEHLAPLRRFLNSNVNRPWNKVYAEICQHVDRGNVVQKHILTHLFDYVVTEVILIDDKPHDGRPGYRYGEPLDRTTGYHQWYVCPRTGLLRRSRHVPRRRKTIEPPKRVRVNKSTMCLHLNGQWELVKVEPIPVEPCRVVVRDVVRKVKLWASCFGNDDAEKFYGSPVYAVSRRPLSRRELLALPIPIEWL